ncbi:unnamed protein product [Medioppia subpectinata]|uniref:Uncharacterized protein n=1 Tax=Medioppia subpectinata TaxID=1979941 RepID=A0A7R9KFT7_9ACAR|nr:unnamed protein product [Medioppia subpectinata]CAG2101546.1 unnamed protein product [Medioppia subpectinata]
MTRKPKVKLSVSPDYPLPPELRQHDCGTHPYVRGLTSHRWADERRHRLHHPVIMFVALILAFIRSIFGYLMPRDRQLAIYVGDYPYFLNVKAQLNLAQVTHSLFGMLALLYYRYLFYKKKYPFPEAPIRLMGGAVTPRSVGLFDEAVIIEMCKSAKFRFNHTKRSTNAFGLIVFVFCLLPVHLGANDWSLFPIYFPWCVINGLAYRYGFNISHWTYTYFFLARMKQTRLMINAQYVKYGVFTITSYLRVVSSVAEEAKKAYKPLNKLQITLKQNSSLCRLKLMAFIEKVGKKDDLPIDRTCEWPQTPKSGYIFNQLHRAKYIDNWLFT